jgi:hypothetical protein
MGGGNWTEARGGGCRFKYTCQSDSPMLGCEIIIRKSASSIAVHSQYTLNAKDVWCISSPINKTPHAIMNKLRWMI